MEYESATGGSCASIGLKAVAEEVKQESLNDDVMSCLLGVSFAEERLQIQEMPCVYAWAETMGEVGELC